MKKIRLKNKILILFCFVILGAFLALQYKTAKGKELNIYESKTEEIQNYREKLENQIKIGKEISTENEKLEKEIENSKKKYFENLNNYKIQKMFDERSMYMLYSGLIDIKGSGVIVTIMDAKEITQDLEQSLIHDIDLVRIINVLIEFGAIGISINEERYLNTSEIICSGPTVRINRKYYPAPYIIKAVGDSNILYDGLEKSKIVSVLRNYGISISIEKKDNIEISKYSGSIDWTISELEEVKES